MVDDFSAKSLIEKVCLSMMHFSYSSGFVSIA